MVKNPINCGYCGKTFGTQGIGKHCQKSHPDKTDYNADIRKWRVAAGYKADPYKSLNEQWRDMISRYGNDNPNKLVSSE